MRYQLYDKPVTAQRNLAYPAAQPHLRRMLQEVAERDGTHSMAGLVLKHFDLSVHSYYITVPYDCPENISIDDLRWGQFYLRTPESAHDERHHAEIETVSQTNSSICSLVRQGDHLLITQAGAGNEVQHDLWKSGFSDPSCCFLIEGVSYAALTSQHSDDAILEALTDPVPDLRFIVKLRDPMLQGTLELTEEVASKVLFVAASIFDYMGYLLWWPWGLTP